MVLGLDQPRRLRAAFIAAGSHFGAHFGTACNPRLEVEPAQPSARAVAGIGQHRAADSDFAVGRSPVNASASVHLPAGRALVDFVIGHDELRVER